MFFTTWLVFLKFQRDTALQLEWLKATKDFHGSVEHSSLTRAKLINECGVYIVGGKESSMPTLEESLFVEITKKLPEDVQGSFFFSFLAS